MLDRLCARADPELGTDGTRVLAEWHEFTFLFVLPTILCAGRHATVGRIMQPTEWVHCSTSLEASEFGQPVNISSLLRQCKCRSYHMCSADSVVVDDRTLHGWVAASHTANALGTEDGR